MPDFAVVQILKHLYKLYSRKKKYRQKHLKYASIEQIHVLL